MNLKAYFQKAEAGHWAIGQFNVSNLETLKAVVKAARALKSPVIIGTSEKESSFIGLKEIAALVRISREDGFPIFLNLDHGKDFEYIKKAVEAGYDAVHFDGSCLELAENIEKTREIVEYCHRENVCVEGELGLIGGSSTILEKIPEIGSLTSPKEAEEFSLKTEIDSLAVNIGNMHGMPKIGKDPRLDLKRLKEIKEKVGRLPIVLHGGSGADDKDVKESIKLGVAKININTELRAAFSQSLKEALKTEEIVPYKYLPFASKSVQEIVEKKIKLFGSIDKVCCP